jgi:hypothetical protein
MSRVLAFGDGFVWPLINSEKSLVLSVSPPLYKNQAYIHPFFFVEMNSFFAGSEIFMEVNNIPDRNSKFLTNNKHTNMVLQLIAISSSAEKKYPVGTKIYE